MRIFVFESITSSSPEETNEDEDSFYQSSLWREATGMMHAAVADFAALEEVEVSIVWHSKHASEPVPPAGQVCFVDSLESRKSAFLHECRAATYVLVIAPEIDGELLEWVELATSVGAELLGPNSDFVRVASDKWATYNALLAAQVPTPDTFLCGSDRPPDWSLAKEWIYKPRDGAGSIHVETLNPEDASAFWQESKSNGIFQPLMRGTLASVSFIIGESSRIAFPPIRQIVSSSSFNYAGGSTAISDEQSARAISSAERAVSAIGTARGFVAVDLILGNSQQGNEDYILEVNPRLVTSYLLLRSITMPNMAGLWVDVMEGDETPYQFARQRFQFSLTDWLLEGSSSVRRVLASESGQAARV